LALNRNGAVINLDIFYGLQSVNSGKCRPPQISQKSVVFSNTIIALKLFLKLDKLCKSLNKLEKWARFTFVFSDN